jgi:hypothetical protein
VILILQYHDHPSTVHLTNQNRSEQKRPKIKGSPNKKHPETIEMCCALMFFHSTHTHCTTRDYNSHHVLPLSTDPLSSPFLLLNPLLLVDALTVFGFGGDASAFG